MKKKLLALLCVAVLTVAAFVIVVNAETTNGTSGDCTWVYDADTKTLTVSGGTKPGYISAARDASIIVLEEGIIELPESFCYNNRNLTKVTFPTTLEVIGRSAFNGCSSLTELENLENANVNTLARGAFYKSGITSIKLNDSLKTVDESAFRYCYELLEADLGNSVETLNANVFNNCAKLTKVVLGGTYTSIPDYTFYKCAALTDLQLSDTYTSIGIGAVRNTTALTSFTVPAGVTSICQSAFRLSGVQTVSILGDLTTIDDYAFYGASNLETINIPASLTKLGNHAFGWSGITAASIPAGVNEIGFEAFMGCSSLREVTIAEGVKIIGINAFYKTAIEEIVIPASVTCINYRAFGDCDSLVSAEVNANITSLPYSCFRGCNALKDVTLSSSITTIEQYAFEETVIEEITLPENLVTIAPNAFINTTSLQSVVIPGSVYRIGKNAFKNSGIASLEISKGVVKVAYGAFESCTNLTEVSFPSTVIEIGGDAFKGSGVTKAYIPDSVTTFGNNYIFAETPSPVTIYTQDTEAGNAIVETTKSWINIAGTNNTYDPEHVCQFGEAEVTIEATPLTSGQKTATCQCGKKKVSSYEYEGCAVALDVVVNGTTVTADLIIVGASDVSSVGFNVNYNAEKLSLTSAKNLMAGPYVADPYLTNPIAIKWNHGLGNSNVNGKCATITFTIEEGTEITNEDLSISVLEKDNFIFNSIGNYTYVEYVTYVSVK